MHWICRFQRVVLGAALVGIFSLVPTAHALSTSSASLDAVLSLVSIDSTSGTFDELQWSQSPSTATFLLGSGSYAADVLTVDDPLGVGVGFDTTLSVASGGETLAGVAADRYLARAFAAQGIGLSNTSTTVTYEVSFALAYSGLAVASLDRQELDTAYAEALINLRVDGALLRVDGAVADAPLMLTDLVNGLVEFSLTLAPGQHAAVGFDVFASSGGISEVPLPAALPLYAFGLLMLACVARRRSE